MTTLVLTQFLYVKDEVVLTFITRLLEKSTLDECLFWIYEYHYSGFDAFHIIWKVYYDFYMLLNPKLERYLQRKSREYTKGDTDALAFAIRNIHGKRSNPEVFLLRQYMSQDDLLPTHIYRGRPPQWVSKYDKDYQPLLRSISKKHWQNVCYYIKKFVENGDRAKINTVLGTYFEHKLILHNYKHFVHQLLARILYMSEKHEEVINKRIYICPSKENLLKIQEIQKPVPLIECRFEMGTASQIYNTLKIKRLYGIADNIGGFMLARDIFEIHEDFVNAMWMHWEYYTKDTPLWTPRYKEYKGTFDHEKKRLVFENDDYLEEFYEAYGYEPDEQCGSVQTKALNIIPSCSWETWYKLIFPDEKSIVSFPEHFKFHY